MAHITADRVKDTTTTTGTGDITLANSAPTGFRTLNAVAATGDTFWYCIEGGAEWEVGRGTYSGSHVFVRTEVLFSSNSNAAVSFSSGTKNFFITIPSTYQDDEVRALVNNGYRVTVAGPNQTNPSNLGLATVNVSGTATSRALADTNYFTRRGRTGSVSSASAGSHAAFRAGNGQLTLMRDIGFRFRIRFGVSDAATVANSRVFCGYSSTATIGNVEPSSLLHVIGIGADAGEANLSLLNNDGSGTCTKTALGTGSLGGSAPAQTLTTDVYELSVVCAPAGNPSYRVERLNTGDVWTGTISSDLPTGTQGLYGNVWRNNGSTALAVGVDLFGWIEQGPYT